MALPITRPNTTGDPTADLAFLAEKLEDQRPIIKQLAKHIDSVWKQNVEGFKAVRQQMVCDLKRIRGEYSDDMKAALKAFRGSEAYFRNAENKCRAATSWVKDIYKGDQDLPWALEPTAVPTLPDETLAEITTQTQQQAMTLQQDLAQRGLPVDQFSVSKIINDYYQEQLDLAKEDLNKEAKERCLRAEKLIRDQNQEAGWNDAFKDFLWYFVRLKFGAIKGPVLTKKKKPQWIVNPDGLIEMTTVEDLAFEVYAPSPFNLFPSLTKGGDLVELHELSRQDIANLIGVPGYEEKELRTVLDLIDNKKLKAKWLTLDDEKQVKQLIDNLGVNAPTTPVTQIASGETGELYHAQEFYGSVSGKLLIEWDEQGELGELDTARQYQVNCWKIGEHVIKAVVNPDPLGRKPYHFSSWAKTPGAVVGEGLIEFSAPVEDAMNAVVRALINNCGIASGPMAEVDKDRVDTSQPIYPWRQIESTSKQMRSDGPAVNYYQPQMHVQELVTAYNFFSQILDEMTVPSYAQGASQSGVTAGTATVFTQLLAAASRAIKAVVANVDDDVIGPYLRMCYDHNMRFSDDQTIKGDANVVPKGVNGLLAREQAAQRKIEFMQVTANPYYMQILGAKNIGAILAQIAQANDIDLPDKARLEGGESAEMALNQLIATMSGADPVQDNGQMANGGGAPTQPQGLNPDGSTAGVNNG
jgi:hypothetical protein